MENSGRSDPAGDDTILVIVKQGVSAQDVAEHMRNMITSE